MNGDESWHGKSGFAHEIVLSGLYHGDIKIKDTFVYEYTRPPPTGRLAPYHKKYPAEKYLKKKARERTKPYFG